MQTDPHFTDGQTAVLDPIIECLNLSGTPTYQRYEYLTDNLDYDSIRKIHSDGDGSHLGSDTRQGALMGSISVQKTLASHKFPRPGHILRLYRGADTFYLVCGKPSATRERNSPTKGSFDCVAAINPVILTCLTEAYGGRYTDTQAAGALTVLASALSTVNTRTGSTLAYSIVAAPGYTLPGWLTCSSSTGALSGTAAAGTFEFDIVCTETLAGAATRYGAVRVSLVVT